MFCNESSLCLCFYLVLIRREGLALKCFWSVVNTRNENTFVWPYRVRCFVLYPELPVSFLLVIWWFASNRYKELLMRYSSWCNPGGWRDVKVQELTNQSLLDFLQTSLSSRLYVCQTLRSLEGISCMSKQLFCLASVVVFIFFIYIFYASKQVGYCKSKTSGQLCSEPRAVKGFPFKAWTRSEYSHACFSHCRWVALSAIRSSFVFR